MSAAFKFWGFDVVEETGPSSRGVGVVVGGVQMLDNTYAVGQRLAQAGTDGVPVRNANRSDIEILRSAGHTIETDGIGLNYYLQGQLRAPEKYLVRVQPKAEIKQAPFITAGWTGTRAR